MRKRVLCFLSARGWKTLDPLAYEFDIVAAYYWRGTKFEKLLSFLRLISFALFTRRYDIYVTDLCGKTGLLSSLPAIASAKPSVLRLRGDPFQELTGWAGHVLKWYHRRVLFPCMDRIVSVSAYLADRLRVIGVPEGKLHVIETPIGHAMPLPVPFEDRKDVLMFVGAFGFLEKTMGLIEIFPAVEAFLKKFESYSFEIYGDGDFSDLIQEKVDGSDARGRILYLGRSNRIDELLASAKLFVYASYLDANPSAIGEAQSHGLPVVLLRQPWTDGIVEDSVSAIVADTPSHLTDALCLLASDEVTWDRISTGGYEATLHRTPEGLSDEFREALQSCAARAT